jgi:hypothetical protein
MDLLLPPALLFHINERLNPIRRGTNATLVRVLLDITGYERQQKAAKSARPVKPPWIIGVKDIATAASESFVSIDERPSPTVVMRNLKKAQRDSFLFR